ncbi:MAG: nucleotide exchange factor GrpE [Methanobrevibacter sp.]|nr:nucleotide exchange factor GrpE [Candidatus Methanovirga meridionalis]
MNEKNNNSSSKNEKIDKDEKLFRDIISEINDENLLIRIANICCDENPENCKFVIKKIKNVDNITKKNAKNLYKIVKKFDIHELNEKLDWYNAKNHENPNYREDAVKQITNENILKDIARSKYKDTSELSINKITDEKILVTISEDRRYDNDIRKKAISKITDNDILYRIVLSNNDISKPAFTVALNLIRKRCKEEADKSEDRYNKKLKELEDKGKIELILKIVDIYETIEKGASLEEPSKEHLKGLLESIYSNLKNVLEKEGLKKIPTKNVKFDYTKHEASSSEKNDECEDDDILEELLRGYTFKDEVIKHSIVKICKNSE